MVQLNDCHLRVKTLRLASDKLKLICILTAIVMRTHADYYHCLFYWHAER